MEKYILALDDVGLERVSAEKISSTKDIQSEAERFKRVLAGDGPSSCVDFTCLNAGAILYISGMCESIREGIIRSKAAIVNGKAYAKLEQWKKVQN